MTARYTRTPTSVRATVPRAATRAGTRENASSAPTAARSPTRIHEVREPAPAAGVAAATTPVELGGVNGAAVCGASAAGRGFGFGSGFGRGLGFGLGLDRGSGVGCFEGCALDVVCEELALPDVDEPAPPEVEEDEDGDGEATEPPALPGEVDDVPLAPPELLVGFGTGAGFGVGFGAGEGVVATGAGSGNGSSARADDAATSSSPTMHAITTRPTTDGG